MTGTAALRRWLRRYNATQAGEAAIIRLWADAAASDATYRVRLDRRLRLGPAADGPLPAAPRLRRRRTPRRSWPWRCSATFGSRERPAPTIDAAAHIFERGFLGR